NAHYVSSTNQAPQIAQKGEPGETYSIILELRLIADVGIIGYPNAGKSTLLAAASAAKPKIASYPFTTREPVLGVVEAGEQSFVLAEIPGLIEGAHLGRGLGHDFLRHALRTKMLIHLVDGSSLSPAENFAQINTELGLFDSALAQKPQLVAINKIDLPEVRARLDTIRTDFAAIGISAHFISAETKEGVAELMAETAKMLQAINLQKIKPAEAVPAKVFRPQPRQARISVHKAGNTFVVVAPEFERIITRPGVRAPEAQWYIKGALMRSRVGKALEKAGVKPGDKVHFGNVEWEW
ncbi:MAG: Obg family GTPase CgtA, partial [Chloroflexi bacterium]|nr:Obg family GTPase CgtA [Chloroflexota bacterium]